MSDPHKTKFRLMALLFVGRQTVAVCLAIFVLVLSYSPAELNLLAGYDVSSVYSLTIGLLSLMLCPLLAGRRSPACLYASLFIVSFQVLVARNSAGIIFSEHRWMWAYSAVIAPKVVVGNRLQFEILYTKTWDAGFCKDVLVATSPGQLASVGEEIAKENARFVDFYRINADRYSAIFCDVP